MKRFRHMPLRAGMAPLAVEFLEPRTMLVGDTVELVKDIFPGTSGAEPSELVEIDGTVYFAADDGQRGIELWKTDGTPEGTVLVKDLNVTYGGNSLPEDLTNVNGTLFFSAVTGPEGRLLWKSDGTAEGTELVSNQVRPGSPYVKSIVAVGDTLFFVPWYETHKRLWKSDGTALGTQAVITVNSPGGVSHLTSVGNTLYFVNSDAAKFGENFELWKSDGTSEGTVVVKDLRADGSANPQELVAVGDLLYFTVDNGSLGRELWKSDGTAAGTVLVKDIEVGAGSSSPQELTDVGGTLYFSAMRSDTGRELWKSDGTAAGTVLVRDILSLGSSTPTNLVNVNGALFFAAADSTAGRELWFSDGTTDGTMLVKDLRFGSSGSTLTSFTNVNGILYFVRAVPKVGIGDNGLELWKSDGTLAGTQLVSNIRPGILGSDGYPPSLIVADDRLYFTREETSTGRELWKVIPADDEAQDLTVIAAELNSPAVFGQAFDFQWTVRNVGGTATDANWLDRIYLSTTPTVTDSSILLTAYSAMGQTLAPGESWQRDVSITLPLTDDLLAGTYYIVVLSDATDVLDEADESNNVLASVATSIALPPLPDLAITAVQVPPVVFAGQPFVVTWTLTNAGSADAVGPWNDNLVFLPMNDGAVEARTFSFNGTLSAGATVVRSQEITLPVSFEGAYRITARTDLNDVIYEHLQTSNNVKQSATFDVRKRPAPDLHVESITAPTMLFAGEPLLVEWRVKNEGTGSTNSSFWYDSVWLSPAPVRGGDAIHLGQVLNSAYLDVQQAYNSTLTWTVPETLYGTYYVIVETDWRNHVDEPDEAYLNPRSWGPLTIELPPPADLRVTDVDLQFSTVLAGNRMDVTWTVSNAGQSDTRAGTWFDDIYLSPTTDFDEETAVRLWRYHHTAPLAASQQYTVARSVEIPFDARGEFFIIVRTDAANHVYEQGFELNNDAVVSLGVLALPTADLEPALLSAPASGLAGYPLTLDYLVANNGAAATRVGTWFDAFYLSADATLDLESDLLLGRRQFSAPGGVLLDGVQVEQSASWTLPTDLEGEYFVFLVADVDESVFEDDRTNNTVRSTATVRIDSAPADLIVELSAPASAAAGVGLLIDWTIENAGTGDTRVASWTEAVYLSASPELDLDTAVPLGTYLHEYRPGGQLSALSAGERSTVTRSVALPYDATGNYYLFVVTDASGDVYEAAGESNNVSSPRPITIERRAADLMVTSVTADATALADGPLQVTWSVLNAGDTATPAQSWVDRVYLSTDETLSVASDLLLGKVTHSSALLPGGGYVQSASFALPRDLQGSYYVLVWTDAGEQVLELDAELNNVTATLAATSVALNPTPDLEVSSIVVPSNAIRGQVIDVLWIVSNRGHGAPDIRWRDYVYLSLDPVFDRQTDRFTTFAEHRGPLAAGESYTASARMRLPAGYTGPYFVFVVADGGAHLQERGGEQNNVALADEPLVIVPPTAVDLVAGLVTIPAQAQVGMQVSIQYEVSNQGLETTAGTWSDALYLSTDDTWDANDVLLGHVPQMVQIGSGQSYFGNLTAPLPGLLPGQYHVLVRSDVRNQVAEVNLGNNWSASLERFDVDFAELSLGTEQTGLVSYGEHLFWKIEIGAESVGRPLIVNFATDATAAANELYVRYGQPPTRSVYDQRFDAAFTHEPRAIVPRLRAGTYYVLAIGDPMNLLQGLLGSYSISADTSGFDVFAEQYGLGGTAGLRTLRIRGVDFDRTLEAVLRDAQGNEVAAVSYVRADSQTLYATFDLRGVQLGNYRLFVSKLSEAEIRVVDDALTVVAGGGENLRVALEGPAAVLRPMHDPPLRFSYSVTWANEGINDARAPWLMIASTAPLGLDAANIPSTIESVALPFGVYTVTYLTGRSISALDPLAMGPLPGWALAGESNALSLFGLIDPQRVDIVSTVHRMGGDVLDEAYPWESWRAELRPAELSDLEYNQAFDLLVSRHATWDGFLDLLARNALLIEPSAAGPPTLRDLLELELTTIRGELFPAIEGDLFASSFDIPVSFVRIVARNVDTGDAYTTRTRRDGSFVFPSVAPGQYSIEVDYPALREVTPGALIVTTDGPLRGVRVELTPGVAIHGTLESLVDEVPADALVYLYTADGTLEDVVVPQQGRFTFEGRATGIYRVVVAATGHERVVREVELTASDVDLDFDLTRGGTLRVAVSEVIDAATAQALVLLKDAPFDPHFVGELNGQQFVFTGLPAGEYELVLMVDGRAWNADGIALGAEEDLDLGTIEVSSDVVGVNATALAAADIGNVVRDLTLDAALLYLEAYARSHVIPTLILAFGVDVGALWNDFLNGSSDHPPSGRTYGDGHPIVEGSWARFGYGFREMFDQTGVNADLDDIFSEAVQLVFEKIATGDIECDDLDQNYEISIEDLFAGRENLLNKLKLSTDFAQAYTIPGNIAGGIWTGSNGQGGAAGQVRDDARIVTGRITVSLSGGEVTVSSRLQVAIIETLDLVPGQPGDLEERFFVSILRSLELNDRAYDVPFNVVVSDKVRTRTEDAPNALDDCCDCDNDETPYDDQITIEKRGSYDPNDIIGPDGVGDERWVSARATLPYTVRFENDAELADAPAQRIRIEQALDADLDWRTFRLGTMVLGSFTIESAIGLPAFQMRYDLQATLGVFVDVLAGIDLSTGTAFWELTAIDPATGQTPVNPLLGLLPPNLDGVEGQGFASYTIRPRADIASGTSIDAEATIYFDINPPIDTPPIANWVDAQAPVSNVHAFDSSTSVTTRYLVQWSGQDEPGGSGIGSFSIYVSENDGPWSLWLDQTALTEAWFDGRAESTYAFYSVAVDRVGHRESPPVTADAQIQVTTEPTNSAPELALTGNKQVSEGAQLSFTAQATDADLPANLLTFSLDAGAPTGASIHPATGVFTWTPTEAQGPGSYQITVRVTDNGTPAASDFETITVTVAEANQAPVLAAIGIKQVTEGAQLSFTAQATDADLPANQLTFSLDAGAPTGASIHPTTGVFTWTPTEAQGPGSYQITVRVTDNGTPALNDFETITINVAEANQAPVLGAIGNKQVTEGAQLSFTAQATDADLPANQLTFSLDVGAPPGASIHPTTGVFTWTPTEAQGPGSYQITVRVTDNGTPALNDFETLTINVAEANQPPVLAAIGNKQVTEGTQLSFTAQATDADLPANGLTFSLDAGAPTGASIHPTTGVFTWTPTEAQAPGDYQITIRVTDNGAPALNDFETISVTVSEIIATPTLPATIGLYEPTAGSFFLRHENEPGPADQSFGFGPPNSGWIPLAGDWDGDGQSTIGFYKPATGTFFLKSTLGPGVAETVFSFGAAGAGVTPLVGDWDGDGTDTVGIYVGGAFFLTNTNAAGPADLMFGFGPNNPAWVPLAGDWNGDAASTLGFYDPAAGAFFLKNTPGPGAADVVFGFGPAGTAWTPLVGDWNADESDTIGLYSGDVFYVRDVFAPGPADDTIPFGPTGNQWTPIVGQWLPSGDPLRVAAPSVTDNDASLLTTDVLNPIVAEAIAQWAAVGLPATDVARLRATDVLVADLPGNQLGRATSSRVLIDMNAAGYGWHIAPTIDGLDPDEVDLLSVIAHELGHVLGLDDLDLDASTPSLMNGQLQPGTRRLPTPQEIDHLFAQAPWPDTDLDELN